MSSEIRVNSLSSRAGLSTVTFTDTGPIFSGITTFQDNSGFNVGTGGSIFSPASNTVTLGTNSAERFRITSDGKVGIGNTNPGDFRAGAENLVVGSGSGAEGMTIYSATNASGRICFADGSGASDEERGVIQYAHDDNHMQFDTNATERLRITSDGKVIIGATSAGGLFSVHQSASSANYINITNGVTGSSSWSNGMLLGPNSSGDALVWQNENSDLRFGTNNLDRMRITSAGQVIVNGTANLGHPNMDDIIVGDASGNRGITVASGSSGYGTLAFGDSTDGSGNDRYQGFVEYYHNDNSMRLGTVASERLRINSAGNIGMSNDMTGAGGVYARLTVQMPTQSGGSGIQVANSSNGSGDGSTSNIVLRSVNNDCSQWADAEYRASQHIFAIQGTERMRINANGYVTKPNQPRFFARRSANYTGYDGRNVGGTWIAYDVLDYNVGGGFQTSGSDQGRFVAPVSGLYLFHAAAYKNTGTGDWSQSWFDVDNTRANGTDFVHSSGTRFAQNAIQVYLAAGQKIGFHPYNNATNNPIVQTSTHTWFKGCLLG